MFGKKGSQRTDPGRRFKCGLSTVGRNLSILPRPQSALPWVPLPPLRGSETLRGLVLIIGEAISLPRAIDEGIKV